MALSRGDECSAQGGRVWLRCLLSDLTWDVAPSSGDIFPKSEGESIAAFIRQAAVAGWLAQFNPRLTSWKSKARRGDVWRIELIRDSDAGHLAVAEEAIETTRACSRFVSVRKICQFRPR